MMRTASGVPVSELVELATRAPSVHNTQPWLWYVDGDRLVLFADQSRQLQHADPDGRDLLISCGAALHHLRVASAAAGWKVLVRRMPNAYNDAQLATILFEPAQPTPEDQVALDALANRRTDRRRPTSWPVPRDRINALLAATTAFGVTTFAVVSEKNRSELLSLIAEAEKAERLDSDYVDELLQWVGRSDDEGIPASSLLRRNGADEAATATSRFPSGTLPDSPPESEAVEPALLVISTSSDDSLSRLRAGEALSAMLLQGSADGFAMVPLSQAIEVDRTRRLLQDELLSDAACPQIVVQVGWPPISSAPVPASPRRPVEDVLGDISTLPPAAGPYQA